MNLEDIILGKCISQNVLQKLGFKVQIIFNTNKKKMPKVQKEFKLSATK